MGGQSGSNQVCGRRRQAQERHERTSIREVQERRHTTTTYRASLFLTLLAHPLAQLVFPVVGDDDLIIRSHRLEQREVLAVV